MTPSHVSLRISAFIILFWQLQHSACSHILENCNRAEASIVSTTLRALAQRAAPASDIGLMRTIAKDDYIFRFGHAVPPLAIANAYRELRVEATDTPGGQAQIMCFDAENRCRELEVFESGGYTFRNGTARGPRNTVVSLVNFQ